MKRLVEFTLDDRSPIIVETDYPEPPGSVVRATKKPGEVLEEAKDTFEEAVDTVHAATERAIVKLRSLSEQPDQVTTKFDFNLSAQFGAVIASANAEASFKVTLAWLRKDEER